MTSYNWTDNPTKSGVAVCNTDILNDCLMHLKYNNVNQSGGGSSITPFCVNYGNKNTEGEGDIIGANVLTRISPYTQPVLTSNGTEKVSDLFVKWKINGISSIGYPYNEDNLRAPYKLFDGNTSQSSYIILSYANEVYLVFKNPVCLSGFEQFFPDATHTYSGSVITWSGTDWVDLTQFSQQSVNSKITVNFQNDIYSQFYRLHYSSSNYTINNEQCLPLCEIRLIGTVVTDSYGSDMYYKVGGNYPDLRVSDISGDTFVRKSVPSKDVSDMADGTYNIFINANNEEYSANTFYRQKTAPDAVTGDIWMDTSTEPLKVYSAQPATYGLLSDAVGYNEILQRSFSTFKGSKVLLYGASSLLSNGTASFLGGLLEIPYNFSPGTASHVCSFNSRVTASFLLYNSSSQYFLNCYPENTSFKVEYSQNNGGCIIVNQFVRNTVTTDVQAITLTLSAPLADLEEDDVIGLEFGYDSTNGSYFAKYFLNGVLTDSNSLTSSYHLVGGTTKLYVGNDAAGNSGYLRASVDLKTFRIRINGEITLNLNDDGTDTVNEISVPYVLDSYGGKIVDGYYRNRVESVFNANGSANYYTLDINSKNYSLPAVTVWQEYDKIPLGQIVVESGEIQSYQTFPFNQNGYHKNAYTI